MAELRPLALVTGASSGLGAAFARDLATRGYDLVLTSRSTQPMEALANEVGTLHGTLSSIIPLDLACSESSTALVTLLDKRGLSPDVLINNAGFGISERFLDHRETRLAEMLALNIIAPTELSLLIGRKMAARGAGRILMVSSLTAFQPNPLMAAYGASKAYLLSLGEALHAELRPVVNVTVLSPGLMNTGFNAASGFATPASLQRFVMTTEEVAAIGLDAMFSDKASIVAGGANKLIALATRFISRQLSARQSMRLAQKAASR